MTDTTYFEAQVFALVGDDPYRRIAVGMGEAMDLLNVETVPFEDWCVAFDSVISNDWFDYIQIMTKYGYRNVHVVPA